MMVNWEFMDNQTPESAVRVVDDLRAGREVRSTRGPRICTWREAERVLAGFSDDLADEGPSAGPASLAGLGIARERGWTAPGAGAGAATAEQPAAAAAGAGGTPESSHGETAREVEAAPADLKHEDEQPEKTAAEGEDAK
jgi:NADH-quinone oxidoreductase subunit E